MKIIDDADIDHWGDYTYDEEVLKRPDNLFCEVLNSFDAPTHYKNVSIDNDYSWSVDGDDENEDSNVPPPSSVSKSADSSTSDNEDSTSSKTTVSNTSSVPEEQKPWGARNKIYPLLRHPALQKAIKEHSLYRKLINVCFPTLYRPIFALSGPNKSSAVPTIFYHVWNDPPEPRLERLRTKIRLILDAHDLSDIAIIVKQSEVSARFSCMAPLEDYDHINQDDKWLIGHPWIGANISAGPTDGWCTLSGYMSITGKYRGRYALTCQHCCYSDMSEFDREGEHGPEAIDLDRRTGDDLAPFWEWVGEELEEAEAVEKQKRIDARDGIDIVPFWERVEEEMKLVEEAEKQRLMDARDGIDLTPFWSFTSQLSINDRDATRAPRKPKLERRDTKTRINNLKWDFPLENMYNLPEGTVTYPSIKAAFSHANLSTMPLPLGRVIMASGFKEVCDFRTDWALLELDEERCIPSRYAENVTPELYLSFEQREAFDEGLPMEQTLVETMPRKDGKPWVSGFRTLDEIQDAIDTNDETRLRVLKFGATTGWRVGRISVMQSPFGEEKKRRKDIPVISLVEDEDFCWPGDSGSLVFDRYGQAIGIFCWYSGEFDGGLFAFIMPFAVMVDHIWNVAGGGKGDEVEVSMNWIPTEDEKKEAKRELPWPANKIVKW